MSNDLNLNISQQQKTDISLQNKLILPSIHPIQSAKAALVPLTNKNNQFNYAKNILKGVGLPLLQAKLFIINEKQVGEEAVADSEGNVGIGWDKKSKMFGLPVWDTITLTSPAYTDNDGIKQTKNTFQIDIALIEIINKRIIVKTEVQGRNETIKEYMSDGDNDIRIRGSFISPLYNIPPYNDIQAFEFMTSVPTALDVSSNFLNYMKIFSLVIEESTIKQREGMRNVYDYTLDCLSDLPNELNTDPQQ